MAYVAPTWKNGAAPALDAAALQAISDAIVANQTKNTQQDSSISSLQSAVSALQSGGAKVATGSYTGTGTYGASNPNSITFPFTPKLVWIYAEYRTDNLTYGYAPIQFVDPSNYYAVSVLSFTELSTSYQNGKGFFRGFSSKVNKSTSYAKRSGNTLYWYNTQYGQLNDEGVTFYWVALG